MKNLIYIALALLLTATSCSQKSVMDSNETDAAKAYEQLAVIQLLEAESKLSEKRRNMFLDSALSCLNEALQLATDSITKARLLIRKQYVYEQLHKTDNSLGFSDNCNANNYKENVTKQIDIENGIDISFNIYDIKISEYDHNDVKITINDDNFKFTFAHGEYYDSSKDEVFPNIIVQQEFQLSKQQIDKIKSLVSDIDNKLHCKEPIWKLDAHIADLNINGKKIFLSFDFQLPNDTNEPYSNDASLNQLIKYLIELSQINIKYGQN